MLKQIKQRINRSVGLIFLIGILLFALTSCKSPSGIDTNFEATITVANLCGATVEIYMDDNLIFSLANGFEQVIDNFVKGSHLLEAFKAGTNMLVATETIDISSSDDYWWDIFGPSRILVTNNYGETLRIMVNGSYLGDLDDTFSEGITKVTFGEHKLDAIKSNDEIAASITIDITEVRDYFWTIQK